MSAGEGLEGEMKNCVVQLEGIGKLRTCYVKIKKCSGVPLPIEKKRSKLTKDEKIVLLPHKKSAVKKNSTNSVKKGRVTKNKKDSKFQLKLTSFFTSPAPKQKTDRCTPDSGIASRSESPDSDQLSNDDDAEEENIIDDTGIKNDFLKSLDTDTGDSDEGNESDKDSSESEDDGSDWEEHGSSVPTYKPKPKRKAPKKAVQPIKFDRTEKSEYENERDKNIQEKDKLLEALKAQWNNFKVATAKPKPKPRTYTYNYTNEDGTVEVRRSTRSVGVTPKYAAGLDDDWRPPTQKRARHDYFEEGNYKPVQREGGGGRGSGKSHKDPNVDVLMPEDITDAMLKRIHYYGKKKYQPDGGTCCHQCRQKTADQKTICRSGVCIGMKGQFCGTCLENRYGESVAEALKDPEWSCPPCRNICNCSFCLETPTGILIHIARAKGFKSVHQYLQHLRSKWDEEKGESQEESEEAEDEDE